MKKHLTVLICILSLVAFTSCSGGGGSSRSGGVGTNSGTGTGTGTGTGGGTVPPGAVGLDINFGLNGFKIAGDTAWEEAFKAKIQQSSDDLFVATEGQLYLRNVIIIDGMKNEDAARTQVFIDSPTGQTIKDPPGAYGTGDETGIILGGGYPRSVWLHEFGHYWMTKVGPGGPSLWEEYSCANCAMAGYQPGHLIRQYCDNGNCTGGNPCWEPFILKKYPSWKHPNTFNEGDAPTVNITVDYCED
ncbi:MAG: hypothetical protein ACYS8W_05790 [Planctomycetota bacterium]|jgi:hypothetical protein